VSIHADDEFSLKIAVESELDDVVPRDGLAAVVIARYRKGRRRRLAGAVGLVVACAGIGVPLGLTSSSGSTSARSSSTVLRLASYALKLPGLYRLSSTKAAPCAAAIPARAAGPAGPAGVVAAASPSGCVVMVLTPPVSPAVPGPAGDPEIPRGARQVSAGRYRAWLIPPGQAPGPAGAGLVIESAAPGGQDLVVGASGLSEPALVALVGAGLGG